MKAPRFGVFARSATGVVALVTLTFSSTLSAETLWWDGTAVAPFAWGTAANWSTTAAPGGADPATAPEIDDLVILSSTGVTAAQTINLNGNQAALGLATTTDNSGPVSILGGDGDYTLSLGASGINHTRGALTIGSATVGQNVNISLTASQNWTSSTAQPSTGTLVAVVVNNNVSNGSGVAQTLTLQGINTGSTINGSITDGTGSLAIVKSGTATSMWTLNGAANNITGGIAVNSGILSITNTGSYGAVSVASGATLRLGTGFTGTQIAALSNGAAFTAGSNLSLNSATTTIAENLTGNYNLTKTGGNTLTLSGTNTYTGTTTIDAGNVVLENTGALATFGTAGATSLTGSGGIIATMGGTGFSVANFEQLRTNTTFAAGTLIGMNVTTADLAYRGEFGGVGSRFLKSGGNTLVLLNPSTYTGTTSLSGGTTVISSLSALGTTGQINIGSVGTAARLRYTGGGETTTRTIRMEGSTGGAVIESAGSGALVLNGAVSGATNGSKTLTLSGTNEGANIFAGNLANYGTGNTTSLTKSGSGNWTLSGNNTHTGTTRVNAGSLTIDYSGGNAPLSTGLVAVQGGDLIFKGASSGVTARTVTTLQVGVGNTARTGIVLDANGGAGVQLTATTLQGSGSTQHHDLLDFSSSAGNSLTVGTLGATMQIANGVLMNNAGATTARASLIVRDTTGYGYATLNGSNQVVRLSTFNELAPGAIAAATGTENYRFSAGSYTAANSLLFNTATFDSTAGAINLTLAATSTFSGGDRGKSALFTGGNDVTISGGATGGIGVSSALWYHNYLSGTAVFNLQSSLGNAQTFLFGGDGLTNYSGTGIGTDLVVNGGIFRMTGDQTLGTANMRIGNSGTFEIGADLNGGATAGDFSKTVGNAVGNIMFYGDAGLSAYTAVAGGTRTVTFGNASLTWGVGHFITNTDNTEGDYAFRLSSARSNATLQITNNIDLNGRTRTVDVANGSADVDAVLSGALSGSVAADLVKAGAGTLSITGTNTYAGTTRVDAGKLIVGGGGLTATTRVHVKGTLELQASNVLNDSADITLENGILIANGVNETTGTLDIIGNNQLDLVGVGNTLMMADSSGVTWDSTLSILNWGGLSTGGGTDQVFFGDDANGLTSDQLSKITFVNPNLDGQQLTGSFGAMMLATGEIVAVPESSAVLLVAFGSLGVAFRRRRGA